MTEQRKHSEILRDARALIDTPDKWCKLTDATDENGEEVSPWSTEAKCFCLIGAIVRIDDYDFPLIREFDLWTADANCQSEISFYDIITFNDAPDTTHEKMLATLDEYIAKLEAEGN